MFRILNSAVDTHHTQAKLVYRDNVTAPAIGTLARPGSETTANDAAPPFFLVTSRAPYKHSGCERSRIHVVHGRVDTRRQNRLINTAPTKYYSNIAYEGNKHVNREG